MRSKNFSIAAGIRRGSQALWRNQNGIAATMMAALLPALVAFSALAIDMSYAYWIRTQLQHAASAAALAGASQLYAPANTENAVKAEAITYANMNMDPARFGTTLAYVDVVLGNWDAVNREFTPMGAPGIGGTACGNPAPQETDPKCLTIDAVEVTTRKAQVNGNQLELFLGGAVGLSETDINTVAIAWSAGGGGAPEGADCYTRGILAGGMVSMSSDNDLTDAFCVYGEKKIKIQSDNCFQGLSAACGSETIGPGVEVMTPDFHNFDEQGGNNPGFYDAQHEGNREPTLAEQAEANYDAAVNGFQTGFWTASGFDYEAIVDLSSFQGYDFERRYGQDVTIGGNQDHIAIIAYKIKVESGARLDHVILVAKDKLEIDAKVIDHAVLASRGDMIIGSDVRLGGAPGTACDPISTVLITQGKFQIGSKVTVRNAQLITDYTGDVLDLQSNGTYEGVAIQSKGDILMGSDNIIVGCALSSAGGTAGPGSGLTMRLVN